MVLDALQYTLGELRDNYADAWWWRHHARGMVHQLVNRPVQRLHPRTTDGDPVMDADWDALVVLDACRADLFEQVVDIENFDTYQRRTSAGSMTAEWVRRNFEGRDLGDTVYVTTNPHVVNEASEAFHHLEPLWEDAFDDDLGTIPHDAVVEAAREMAETYPEKRLIVHFVQPHHPFIADERVAEFSRWDVETLASGERPSHPHDPFEADSMGLVETERVWDAYRGTLDLVIDDTLDLAADLGGRTVVTSDHGNMFGEPGWPIPVPVYGHPPGLRHPELVEVPWAVIDDDDRPEITDGGTDTTAVDDDVVEERLRDLGYV